MKKERLDILLTEKGLAPSREKAKTMIMEGLVYVNGQKEDKAGSVFPLDAEMEVRGQTLPFVSRGGLKLAKALQVFDCTVDQKVCMDVGASTGGFTDCMLQNGAAKVYSADVGYGQLAWSLRQDPRVVCMEKTNVRYLKPEDLPEKLDFASVDVSFISLTYIIPYVDPFLKPDGRMVFLIKPQFEAGPSFLNRSGIVTDEKGYKTAIQKVLSCALNHHYYLHDLAMSTLFEKHKNVEFLALFSRVPTRYEPDYNALFQEVKAVKKVLR